MVVQTEIFTPAPLPGRSMVGERATSEYDGFGSCGEASFNPFPPISAIFSFPSSSSRPHHILSVGLYLLASGLQRFLFACFNSNHNFHRVKGPDVS
jgi:hypothetical protein